jgi:hypothetical protein
MVYGLEKFKEYFRDYSEHYVIIGGTACDILLNEMGIPFRATKDIDLVLIIEVLDESFGIKFWEFINDGGYKHYHRNMDKEQFYRFSEPSGSDFPSMIELFSRKPNKMNLHFDSFLLPIHISDSIPSLSTILLNDKYYNLLLNGKTVIDSCSVLKLEYLVLFKIRAWLDMTNRVNDGDLIDSKTVKKHKNDIFRLIINISPLNRIVVEDEIRKDIIEFIEKIKEDRFDLNTLGIRTITYDALIERIKEIYLI